MVELRTTPEPDLRWAILQAAKTKDGETWAQTRQEWRRRLTEAEKRPRDLSVVRQVGPVNDLRLCTDPYRCEECGDRLRDCRTCCTPVTPDQQRPRRRHGTF